MGRTLYLAWYDIREPKRLVKCLKILKGYASGRQYSCFECYLNDTEQACLLHNIRQLTEEEDTFALLSLKRSRQVKTLGQGTCPQDEQFMWIG